METIALFRASDWALAIDVTDEAWCRCTLIGVKTAIFLGAESLSYLRDHLMSIFDQNAVGIRSQWAGYDEVRWILTLAEAYHSLYVANDGPDRTLLWQDKHAQLICTMRLTLEDCARWRSQIESME